MTASAIRVVNVAKRYRLGERQPYRTLRDTLSQITHASLQRLAPSRATARSTSTHGAELWALKDVTFEIERGDVVGLIGRNAAGKSTLLKVISRVIRPTLGHVEIRGRVGSLLEVGTGFHPELTGRENVYLNGAVLGMKKAEIDRRFDEIIAFSEVEALLDTPVKRYSSGMYMRLAFAVAAHLEPDILIVDEVLAVGDHAFQKKCLGKMHSVAKQGRTILFVSHALDTVRRLCPHAILLDDGRLIAYGRTPDVVARYLSTSADEARPGTWINLAHIRRLGTGESRFVAMQYRGPSPASSYQPCSGDPLEFLLALESDAARSVGSLSVTIYSELGTKLIDTDTNALDHVVQLKRGITLVKIRIERLHLNPGRYRLGLWLADPISGVRSRGAYDFIETAFEFEVLSRDPERTGVRSEALVSCDFSVMEGGSSDLPDWIGRQP